MLHSKDMRLNAYLAGQLGMSRRQADELIQKGFIEIDGEIATFTDSVGASSTLRVYRNHSWETVRTTVRHRYARRLLAADRTATRRSRPP